MYIIHKRKLLNGNIMKSHGVYIIIYTAGTQEHIKYKIYINIVKYKHTSCG